MAIRRPEPGTFESLLQPASVAIASLVRLSRFAGTEPYWSKRAVYRFDDAWPIRASQFGVLYAGDSLETAFCESIIHDCAMFDGTSYVVARADLKARRKVFFKHVTKRRLVFADLTGDNLKTIGLNNDISAGDDYSITQPWARAIHDCSIRWDGIRYMSRQRNEGYAYAIFERSGLVKDRHEAMRPADLDDLCSRFNVATR